MTGSEDNEKMAFNQELNFKLLRSRQSELMVTQI